MNTQKMYIHRFISALRNVKIQSRLFFVFCFISLAPVICLGFYAYHTYTNSINDKLGRSTLQSVSSLNKTMSIELEKFQNYCDTLSVSSPIQETLTAVSLRKEPLTHDMISSINQMLTTIPFQSKYLKNLRVADVSGTILYDLGYDDIPQARFSEIIQEIDAASPKDSLQYIHTYRQQHKLVLGRKLYAFGSTEQTIGYIMVYIDEALLSNKIFSQIDFGKGSNIMLINSKGLILSSQDPTLTGTELSNTAFFSELRTHLKQGEQIFNTHIGSEMFLTVSTYSPELDTYLVSYIPKTYISEETASINHALLYLSVFLILLSLCCTMVVYFSIVSPIRNIVAFCSQTTAASFSSGRIQDNSSDELGLLSRTIDSMMDDLQELLRHNKAQEMKKRKLELQMLQYQINPHFLFNTLNSLHWVAILNDVPVLADGLSSLSSLLQNTLKKEEEFISLEEEIENLNHYFMIQKIRYGNSFDVCYHLNPDTLAFQIPRFILQPLAENAILHGASDSADMITITISSYFQNSLLWIVLSDNGKGITTTQLETLNSERTSSGIGIRNVKERLRLYYGDTGLLEITGKESVGTICKISIPFQKERNPSHV